MAYLDIATVAQSTALLDRLTVAIVDVAEDVLNDAGQSAERRMWARGAQLNARELAALWAWPVLWSNLTLRQAADTRTFTGVTDGDLKFVVAQLLSRFVGA